MQVGSESVEVPVGGTLRFAMGSPNGPRSSTWSIIGHKRTRDLYIGCRSNMHEVKVSLHESGRWRFGYTAVAAAARGIDSDREMLSYDPPAEVAPGWRHGASVSIPRSSLRESFPERARAIQWWPPV